MAMLYMILFLNTWLEKYKRRKKQMTKKKITKKTKRKKETEFQKGMKKHLNKRFSGLKFKNLGDGITEISFN